ncbi:hypothetical protein [Saccharothrix obliqua]|uniref:hypothetical protein n=1 Tax=Saccharothrix obliqua TaxID=2861747 RepID=UPI001C5FCF8F|nr:hypothetical protein [Saccharothrix obliqua]MBW4722378.1 hypothetical protein [Saccharothrix obliqua]
MATTIGLRRRSRGRCGGTIVGAAAVVAHARGGLVAEVNQVNQPESVRVRLRTRLSAQDARVLDETLAWYADVRSRQAGVTLLVEGLLIDWLAEATGQNRAAVVQRLALAVERLLPPE